MMKNKLLFYICIFIFSALKGTEEGDPQESLHVSKCKKKVCLEYSHKKGPHFKNNMSTFLITS